MLEGKMIKKIDPKILTWGTPETTGLKSEKQLSMQTWTQFVKKQKQKKSLKNMRSIATLGVGDYTGRPHD